METVWYTDEATKKLMISFIDATLQHSEVNQGVIEQTQEKLYSNRVEGSDEEDISDLKRLPRYKQETKYVKIKGKEKRNDILPKDSKKAKTKLGGSSSSDLDQEINANMVFMLKWEKVISDSEEMFIIAEEDHCDVILEKIIIDLEDEVVSLLEKEKENLEIIESLKSKGFESSENAISESENQSKNDCQEVEKVSLWIIESGLCSKHMTGNRALLTNFVEKFLGTVRFGNNDFAVIVGYGDVVIGSMTIKKVYYVEGLGHNLFSVGQFCDKGLEVAFRKYSCFVRTEDGVDLLTGDRSSNLYTIALNDIASNSSACLLAKAFSSQSWLWHQRLSHLNFATINNLVKNNLVRGLPKMKFEKDHLCSACEQGKIHRKHHKSKTAFASNKPLYLLHMDLCGTMRVESINEKRYVLVVVDIIHGTHGYSFFIRKMKLLM
ncbi:retrovirus-related pol polyprotein from transposon TNT 1-94 [Tanacetum coccineum]